MGKADFSVSLETLGWAIPKSKTTRVYSSHYWIAVQEKFEELKSELELARLDLVE